MANTLTGERRNGNRYLKKISEGPEVGIDAREPDPYNEPPFIDVMLEMYSSPAE
ncbi:MAG: hypothetical protein AB1439_01105 [candidate division FCPU426 bacterium]